jgi:hypothetical protein
MKKKVLALILESRGVTGVMTALVVAIFVAILALVIDLGHVHGVRNELQNAADAAALAGARALVRIEDYPVVPASDPPFCGAAFEKAREAILANKSDGASLQMDLGATLDVTLGWWQWGTGNPTFTPYIYQYPGPDPVSGDCSLDKINAVNVVVRRSDTGASAGPSVFTTFAKLFGWDSAPVVASSTAAIGYLYKNCTPWPLGLCEEYWQTLRNLPAEAPYATAQTGRETGDYTDEMGWAAPCGTNPTPPQRQDMLEGRGPCLTSGECIELQEGVTSTWGDLQDRVNQARDTNDLYPPGDPRNEWQWECPEGSGTYYQGWMIVVPIVAECTFNKDQSSFHFKPILIRNVWDPNDPTRPEECDKAGKHCMEIAAFPCPVEVQGEPGSPTPGPQATRPKLVQFDRFYSAPPSP